MENSLEEKLSSILKDPNMMQNLQSLAKNLTQSQASATPQSVQSAPMPDLSGTQNLSSLASMAGGAAVDANQKALLTALSPYLSQDRVIRLENAMRAAKVARMASGFLSSGGLQLLTGR